jgi:glycosyltransferase involved in cell wall biosynthesis
MRILLLTTWFALEPGDSNLINDLVAALAEQGHDVQVVLLDWSAAPNGPARRFAFAPSVDMIALSPRSIGYFGPRVERATKWLLSSWYARRQMKRSLNDQTYDLMIGFSMASVTMAQNLYAERLCRRSYMVMWDFFPYHHRSIGLITNAVVFNVAYWLENWLIGRFDVIGCMTPANESYLKSRYKLRAGQKTEILPIWGRTDQPLAPPRAAMRAAFELPADKKILVFGGALTEGRGLDDILAAAELAEKRFPELAFLIIGDGRLAGEISAKVARSGSNIFYRKRVPRASYLDLLTACDAGLVCTVRNVDVPTFPSKTIDYLRAGIPIVASVEASTDYGEFIRANGLGGACLAGDPDALVTTAAQIVTDPELAENIRMRTKNCLDRMFDVKKVAKQMVDSTTGTIPTSVSRGGVSVGSN